MVKYHHHWILVNFTSKMKQPSQYTADGAGSHCKRRRNCHSHKNQLKTTQHAKFLTGCWIGLEFIGPLDTN